METILSVVDHLWAQDSPIFPLSVGGKTKSSTATIKDGKPVQGQTQFATLKLQKCDQNNPPHQIWGFS